MEERTYLARCQGFVSSTGLRVPEHDYNSETPLKEGSHGTCPECRKYWMAEINGELENMFSEPESRAG